MWRLDGDPDVLSGKMTVGELLARTASRHGSRDVMRHEEQQLARFRVPRHIWIVQAADWPLTGPEKIHKPALRNRAMKLATRA